MTELYRQIQYFALSESPASTFNNLISEISPRTVLRDEAQCVAIFEIGFQREYIGMIETTKQRRFEPVILA